jgi:hypothetical protein
LKIYTPAKTRATSSRSQSKIGSRENYVGRNGAQNLQLLFQLIMLYFLLECHLLLFNFLLNRSSILLLLLLLLALFLGLLLLRLLLLLKLIPLRLEKFAANNASILAATPSAGTEPLAPSPTSEQKTEETE